MLGGGVLRHDGYKWPCLEVVVMNTRALMSIGLLIFTRVVMISSGMVTPKGAGNRLHPTALKNGGDRYGVFRDRTDTSGQVRQK